MPPDNLSAVLQKITLILNSSPLTKYGNKNIFFLRHLQQKIIFPDSSLYLHVFHEIPLLFPSRIFPCLFTEFPDFQVSGHPGTSGQLVIAISVIPVHQTKLHKELAWRSSNVMDCQLTARGSIPSKDGVKTELHLLCKRQ